MIEVIVTISVVCVIALIVNMFGVGDKKKPLYETISLKESMDLCNVPVVTFINNGKKFNFVFDSGASESHISSAALAEMETTEGGNTVFACGVVGSTQSNSSKMAVLTYKDINYNIELFETPSLDDSFATIKQNLGVQLHGIIGNEFLREYGYVLDFNKLIAYSAMS